MINHILIILAITLLPVFPARTQDSHHGHDYLQHGRKPERVITPVIPNLLKAHEDNKVILLIQDRHANRIGVSQFEIIHTKPVHLLIIEPYDPNGQWYPVHQSQKRSPYMRAYL